MSGQYSKRKRQGMQGQLELLPARRIKLPALVAVWVALCALGNLSVATGEGVSRAALVIGNAHYDSVGALKNSVNDARDMCHELSGLGFKASCYYDVRTRIQLRAIIQDFVESLPSNTVSFIYYAGHAIQANGENYLIPTGVALQSASAVKSETVSVSYLMQQLGGAQDFLNVVILDACRDNPFASVSTASTQGLAPVTDVPDRTMVLYATAADELAIDGTGKGRNGIMTGYLLANLREPGTVDDLFKTVSLKVQKDTESLGRPQKPALYTNFGGQFCLVKCTNLELLQAQKQQLDEKLHELEGRAAAGDSSARSELEAAKRENDKLAAEIKKKNDEARLEDKKKRDEFVPPAL